MTNRLLLPTSSNVPLISMLSWSLAPLGIRNASTISGEAGSSKMRTTQTASSTITRKPIQNTGCMLIQTACALRFIRMLPKSFSLLSTLGYIPAPSTLSTLRVIWILPKFSCISSHLDSCVTSSASFGKLDDITLDFGMSSMLCSMHYLRPVWSQDSLL